MTALGFQILDFLMPQFCAHCGKPTSSQGLCHQCKASTPSAVSPMCPICALPFQPPALDHPCPTCHERRRGFALARSAYTYRGRIPQAQVIAHLLHRFKYGRDITLARPLGRLLAERCPFPQRHDVLIPVPLHRKRLRWRGFNQALLLARPLARKKGIPIDPRSLVRIRATTSQVGLGERARRHNLHGAFTVARPAAVRRRKVLLVDDVYTTGATADECARELYRAGARRVDVFVLARAVRP